MAGSTSELRGAPRDPVSLNHLSLSVCPLTFWREFDDGTSVGDAIATGFLWRHKGAPFLITNWHNVTGRHPVTNECMGRFCPNRVRIGVKVVVDRPEPGRSLVGVMNHEVPLTDGYGEPLWVEHTRGRDVDCVALPMEFPAWDICNKFLNEYDFQKKYSPEIADDAFIIGYPKGLRATAETPIWKRASVASEPSLNHCGKPMLLVDSASRKGMSGSPVIVRHSGIWSPSGEMSDGTVLGTIYAFLGVYSGREDDDDLGVQLGHVWKAELVDEILAGASKQS